MSPGLTLQRKKQHILQTKLHKCVLTAVAVFPCCRNMIDVFPCKKYVNHIYNRVKMADRSKLYTAECC